MADSFGVTAWGRTWLRTVERTASASPNPSLPTARSLARNGAVVFGKIAPGRVSAEVAARGKVSTVTMSIPTWEGAELETVAELLRVAGIENPSAATGELPDAVVAELHSLDIAIAVEPAGCAATCTCSSRRSPCVHHLATVYALAGRIDEEPAVAVMLRSLPSAGSRDPLPSEWISLADIDVDTYYG